jgi:uncharacterized protein
MIVTYTGKYFDFDNMDKNVIDVVDITHALSRINRFVGHSVRAYSVTEHTLLGLMIAMKLKQTPLQQLHWLLHDFTEAYVGDCPSPLKMILPEYQRIEREVAEVIYRHVGVAMPTAEEKALVDRIDRTMLLIEMRDLTLHDHSKHLNDNVYLEALADEDLVLCKKELDAGLLTDILTNQYKRILQDVKKNDR